MGNVDTFLKSLLNFDKDNTPENCVAAVESTVSWEITQELYTQASKQVNKQAPNACTNEGMHQQASKECMHQDEHAPRRARAKRPMYPTSGVCPQVLQRLPSLAALQLPCAHPPPVLHPPTHAPARAAHPLPASFHTPPPLTSAVHEQPWLHARQHTLQVVGRSRAVRLGHQHLQVLPHLPGGRRRLLVGRGGGVAPCLWCGGCSLSINAASRLSCSCCTQGGLLVL